jgi:hypothetical protein
VRDLGVAGALLLAPIVPMAVAYARVQAEMGLKRTLADWVVTRPASFLASPAYAHSFLLSRLFPGAEINGAANAYLFPGYIPLLLAAAALVAGARSGPSARQSSVGVYALLVLSCVWLAVGPPFGLWPLVYWLPGLNFIRVASRFMLPAVLGLSVLAGLGFDWLTRRLREPARLGAAAAVGVLLVAEFAVPLTTTPYAVVTPPADRWLARQAVPFTVAEVPLPPVSRVYEFEKRQAEFMLHSTEHWQKTVHGWSGLQPPAHLALRPRRR